ncbi:MAG TPA: response regulator [Burkholderiales bacterium]|jgi:DNA-binding response OmpR family regulator|nr:response regulator [Burkholderiales bacterium]
MRILILDDNADMVRSLELVLQQGGFDAATALNGKEALALQRQQPADVLITDILMPDLDGMEIIDEFRKSWPRVRIIAMSGGGEMVKGDYLSVAGQIGADVTLRKPVDPDRLVQLLKEFER